MQPHWNLRVKTSWSANHVKKKKHNFSRKRRLVIYVITRKTLLLPRRFNKLVTWRVFAYWSRTLSFELQTEKTNIFAISFSLFARTDTTQEYITNHHNARTNRTMQTNLWCWHTLMCVTSLRDNTLLRYSMDLLSVRDCGVWRMPWQPNWVFLYQCIRIASVVRC